MGRRHRHQRQDDDDRAHRAPARLRAGIPAERRRQHRPSRPSRRSPSATTATVLVAEVSSFQLALTDDVPPAGGRAAQHHAGPPRLARLARGVRGGQGAGLRAIWRRTTSPSSTSTTRARRRTPTSVESRGVPVVRVSRTARHAEAGPRSSTACWHSRPRGGHGAARAPRRAADHGAPQREQRAGRGRGGARARRARRRTSSGACAPSSRSSTASSRSASRAASSSSTTARPRTPTRCSRRSTAFGDRPLVVLLGGRTRATTCGRSRGGGCRALQRGRALRRGRRELAAAFDGSRDRASVRTGTWRRRSRSPASLPSRATPSCCRRRARRSTSSRLRGARARLQGARRRAGGEVARSERPSEATRAGPARATCCSARRSS